MEICSEVGLACENKFMRLIYMHDDDVVTSRLVPMYLYNIVLGSRRQNSSSITKQIALLNKWVFCCC